MDSDDKRAREERARRIREQIERMKHPAHPESEASPEPISPLESPRDFVHRKMREIEEDVPDGAGEE